MMANAPSQGQVGPETYSALAKQLFGKEPAAPETAPALAALTQQADLSGALNLNMGNLPKTSEGVFQERMKIAPQLGAATAGLESAKMGVENEVLAGRAQEQERYGQNVAAGMDKFQEDQRNWPLPEFHPTQENAQSIGELFSLVATFGVLMGAGAKGSAQAAMGSMTGMLDGWKKGRKDLYERELKEFDKNFQRMKAVHEDMRKDFEDYLKLAVNDRDAASLKLEAIIRKAGSSSIAAKLLTTGQLQQYDNLLQNGYKLLADKEAKVESIRQHNEKMKMDQKRLDLDREKFDFEKEVKRKEMMAAGPSNYILQQTGVRVVNDKFAEKLIGDADALKKIEDLQTRLRDPEIRAGLLARAAPTIQKILSAGDKPFDDQVRENLNGNDKTTVFLKDALLAQYAIESAAKGGQRLTVFDMKTRGPVLDPTNYKPETYDAVLDGRRKELFGDMGRYIPKEGIDKLKQQSPYKSFDEEYKSQQTKETKLATSADIDATAKGQKITVDEAKKRLRAAGYQIEGE